MSANKHKGLTRYSNLCGSRVALTFVVILLQSSGIVHVRHTNVIEEQLV